MSAGSAIDDPGSRATIATAATRSFQRLALSPDEEVLDDPADEDQDDTPIQDVHDRQDHFAEECHRKLAACDRS